MKYCLSLLLILTIIFTSCEQNPQSFKTRRVISNESGYVVQIDIYEPFKQNGSFLLQIGDENVQEEICEITETTAIVCGLLLSSSDSVTITFNNERKLKYCLNSQRPMCFNGDRNIRFMPFPGNDGERFEGWVTNVVNDTHIHTYTITEEDYQNAELIGG